MDEPPKKVAKIATECSMVTMGWAPGARGTGAARPPAIIGSEGRPRRQGNRGR